MEINNEKMEELLKLIEELVVNKIRIEKIQDQTIEMEVKKILGQEVQTVSKIQEVVKKIQTERMKAVYESLSSSFGESFKFVEVSGSDAEFDNYNERHIFNIISFIIKDALKAAESNDEKIKLSSRNDTSSLIVEVTNKKSENFKNFIVNLKKEYASLTHLDDIELDQWAKFLFNEAKEINSEIELYDEDTYQRILITVPLSSSIIKAQLVEINNQTYAIPMECIEKVMHIDTAERRMSNGIQLINYMGSIIPVIPIGKSLGFDNKNDFSNYVVLKLNNKMKVLPVNSLLEQTDVVVRRKPKAIQEVKEFKGMAVLGDGYVTMVFDIPYLLGNLS